MDYYKCNDEEMGKAIEAKLFKKGSITEKDFSDMMADRLSKREIMWKYSKELQKIQREKNELKQQLAEKEQQIETQKSNIEFLYDLFVSPQGEQTLKAINQDKISFAVEQLEKVKWIVEDIQCACGDDYNISRDFLFEEIDNQIKQLKEGK